MAKSFLQTNFNDASEVTDLVSRLFSERRKSKWQLEKEWIQQIAWFIGEQHLVWHHGKEYLQPIPTDPWRVRMVVNLMQSAIRQLIAKNNRNQPTWDVLPATSDSSDIALAELQKALLATEYEKLKMKTKLLDSLFWVYTTGNSFLRVDWDPNIGPRIKLDNALAEITNLDELNIGDTKVEVISPFSILTSPSFQTLEDAWWILESRVVDIGELEETFGKRKVKGLKANAVSTQHNFKSAEYLSNIGIKHRDHQIDNGVLVHELFIKPRPEHKQLKSGRRFIVSDNVILRENKEYPYEHNELPYIHLGEIKVPGSFWYTSTAKQLIPVQSDYNKIKSQLIENRNLMSRPKWAVPRGSRIEQTAITDEPGEVINYNIGLKPEPIQMPQLPVYVSNMLVEHRTDFQDISGQHEVSNAQAPGQVRGSQGILALIEQDESRQEPVREDQEQKLIRLGQMLLSINKQFVKEPRILRTVGQNNQISTKIFLGKDLVGANENIIGINYFDVKVRTANFLASSRAAQIEILTSLLDRQVLNPQTDRNLIFSLLNMGQVERQLDKSVVHRNKQIQENALLSRGEQVQVETWEDHDVHIEVLNEFRNSSEFSNFPDEIRQAFEDHRLQHLRAKAFALIEPELIQQQVTTNLFGPSTQPAN